MLSERSNLSKTTSFISRSKLKRSLSNVSNRAPNVRNPRCTNASICACLANLDGDVDGEMGVNALHLVTVAVGDALHHVFDVTDDGSHSGDVLTAAEPFLHLNPADDTIGYWRIIQEAGLVCK